ncbi:hypothetical protein C900_05158 [Fulvivirga imtechensis AK7]|uniref:HEAT repeat domain-containing protein n=1 Tax=Fulvivirga imtechensis AK7 TaxID=1237149 RepID=L8JPM4_9BACT|nr:hypothetical protein [Fulvivirga imtechensis]ELR69317.1 hypothetical protein C900_05158 [Fulvivirga imtechensis AK7]
MSRKNWTDDKLLLRLINNKSERTRWENISVLRKRPSEALFLKCVELTKSEDPKKRKIGIDILAQFGLPPRPFLNQSIKVFFDLLQTETDPKVLMALLYAISHNNSDLNQSQIQELCRFSNNDNEYIKEGLVAALLGIDDPQAIKTLIQLSSDRLSHIRDWATFGIGTQIDRNNKKIREALWNRVNDRHQDTKLEAILGLAKRKDSRVKDIIIRELIDGEFGSILFEAIIELEDKELLPHLETVLESSKNNNDINVEWIEELKLCIQDLKELPDKRKTTHNTKPNS